MTGAGGAGNAGSAPGGPAAKPKGSRLTRFAKDTAFVLISAIVLSFLLKTFLIQSFYIPSESMEMTLMKLDRVVVTKLAPALLDVHRGDIVVFHDPGDWVSQSAPLEEPGGLTGVFRSVAQALGLAPSDSEGFVIKRVIGVGGDRVQARGGDAPVTVNGIPLDETYLAPGQAASSMAFDVVVPPDAVWLMGDNRGNSADSRAHQDGPLGGAVSLDDVVGVAQLRTWPFDRIGLLRNPGAVFAGVPNETGGK
jgi:signal peptidase I